MNRPYCIAEIGGNHEGDFNLAVDLCQLAISTGVDAVKFQIYTGDSIVSRVESPKRHEHFQKFELTRDQHIYLAELCADNGVSYMASVWDLKLLDWIDPYLTVYKVGSGDMTAWPLIDELCARGKPIVLSTGLSDLEEIERTFDRIVSRNALYSDESMLCLLQCTSMYPISESEANLSVMQVLRQKFGVTVGYSDHTTDSFALEIAVAMGARVLEFHFTDTRSEKVFRDHQVSLTPNEVVQLRERIARILNVQGSPHKTPQSSEVDAGHVISFRRGVYLVKDMRPGDVISSDDLCFLRPCHGTDARDFEKVVGARLLRDAKALTALQPGIHYSSDGTL